MRWQLADLPLCRGGSSSSAAAKPRRERAAARCAPRVPLKPPANQGKRAGDYGTIGEKDERREQHQVHAALEPGGPAGHDREHATTTVSASSTMLGRAEAEEQRPGQPDRGERDGRDGQADAGHRRAERQVEAGLHRGPGRPRARPRCVSGSSTSSAITTPTTDCGKPGRRDPGLDRRRLEPWPARRRRPARRTQQAEAGQRRRADGGVGVRVVVVDRLALAGHRQEEVAVRDRLGDHEHRVQRERGDRGEGQLGGGELRAGRRSVKVGRTRLRVARVVTVASAAPVPSALKLRGRATARLRPAATARRCRCR